MHDKTNHGILDWTLGQKKGKQWKNWYNSDQVYILVNSIVLMLISWH